MARSSTTGPREASTSRAREREKKELLDELVRRKIEEEKGSAYMEMHSKFRQKKD